MMNEEHFCIQLGDEIAALSRISAQLHKQLDIASEGRLHILVRDGRYPTYYRYIPGKRRYYLPKSNLTAIKELAQKDYYQETALLIDSRLQAANALLQAYTPSLSKQYSLLSPYRRQLITPVIPTDEVFIQNWYADNPGFQNPYPISHGIMTARGETVRSKSEKILADLFYSKNIPYVYEPMLKWPGYRTLYPDFLVLNVRLRKAYYYEHFGMMDNDDYRNSRFDLISDYRTHGYWEGENLLYDFEGNDYQLNMVKIEEMVNHYLL